jgi:hypothetical protein
MVKRGFSSFPDFVSRETTVQVPRSLDISLATASVTAGFWSGGGGSRAGARNAENDHGCEEVHYFASDSLKLVEASIAGGS